MARDQRVVAQWLLTTGVFLNSAGIFLSDRDGGGLLALKVSLHTAAVVLWIVAARMLWRARRKRMEEEVSRGKT